jgi:hypothetical protein
MSARRTSFQFSAEAMAQLEAIRESTHIADNAEVIRIALNAYDELAQLTASGHHMFVRDREGEQHPYSLFVKLTYPGLNRERFNREAEAAAKTAKPASFFFVGDIIRQIESLRHRSRLSSNVDTIRVAMSAFKELVLIAAAGDILYICDQEGEHPFSAFQPFQKQNTQDLGEGVDGHMATDRVTESA